MAKLPEPPSPTREAIFAAYEADRDAGFRPHLGASQVGKSCERALWYDFRWTTPARFPGRILRLFETGQLEEARIVRNLRRIGATVLEVDPETGRQWRVEAHGGHFGGSLDAVALNLQVPQSKNQIPICALNIRDNFYCLLTKLRIGQTQITLGNLDTAPRLIKPASAKKRLRYVKTQARIILRTKNRNRIVGCNAIIRKTSAQLRPEARNIPLHRCISDNRSRCRCPIRAENRSIRNRRTLIICLPRQTRFVNSAQRLQIKLRDPHILACNFYIFIIFERKRDRLFQSQRFLRHHINSDETEIGQSFIVILKIRRNRGNILQILRLDLLHIINLRR